MLIVKDLALLADYGFKKDRKDTYYYDKDKPFYLWVNPFFDRNFNCNQLVIEFFKEDVEDEVGEYASYKYLDLIYRLINDGVVERKDYQ